MLMKVKKAFLPFQDSMITAKKSKSPKIPTGRVVGIIKRNWRQYCGILQKSLIKGVSINFYPCSIQLPRISPFLAYAFNTWLMGWQSTWLSVILWGIFCLQTNRHLFLPAERQVPKIRIETRQAKELEGQRIIVAIDSWPRTSRYPQVSTCTWETSYIWSCERCKILGARFEIKIMSLWNLSD